MAAKGASGTGRKMHLNQGVKITNCSCKSEYQDKKYGKGLRLHNATQNAASNWRCTSCGIAR